MSPRRFYIGFPPALVKTTRNGIEYGLGSIPLGGYVKIPGMHRPAPSDVDLWFGRAVEERPQLVGPTSALRSRLERGDHAGAREELDELERKLEGQKLSPLALRQAEKGFRELRDALSSDAYWRQRTWKRIAVIFAGPGTNLLLAIVLFTALYAMGSGAYRLGFALRASNDRVTNVVDEVFADHPAAQTGLRAGDRIVAINGRRVGPSDISTVIGSSHGRPIVLVVERDGRRIALPAARPRKDVGDPLPTAAWNSVKLTGLATKEIGASLARLVRGENRKEVSSAVGIVQASSSAAREGARTFLWVLGLISLSLALLNLLPLLPLDGGHIAFSIVEGLRGRAVGRGVYERASAIGIAFVLLLFFIGLSNDIGRIGGG